MLKITFQEQKFWKLKTKKKMLKAMKMAGRVPVSVTRQIPMVNGLTCTILPMKNRKRSLRN